MLFSTVLLAGLAALATAAPVTERGDDGDIVWIETYTTTSIWRRDGYDLTAELGDSDPSEVGRAGYSSGGLTAFFGDGGAIFERRGQSEHFTAKCYTGASANYVNAEPCGRCVRFGLDNGPSVSSHGEVGGPWKDRQGHVLYRCCVSDDWNNGN